ncbi:hypothetical protein L211DRAFT_852591 [Terfezia boudieri ATCC MYA-4762]|uniref:Uncharacterized protein n=1 Tax=Terfezia boudieri ATCC MYA-4762 TaxID=1051890 RepID=A0A3N4LB41_9PEZI|nr:hypothetical protein L211DRAFT_852591 [Terfezia boudieri ATCC MYA-4762]
MSHANERYAPIYWLQRWEEATGKGEHEVALGYAHLALILCQEVYFALHPTCGKSSVIDSAIRNTVASFLLDGNNIVENEHILYFESLKCLAIRNIWGSLMALGYYGEALNVTEFMLNPKNWLIELPKDERIRMATTYEERVRHDAETLKREYDGKTYLRHHAWLWKSPYDIDTSTKKGISRLEDYIIRGRSPRHNAPKLGRALTMANALEFTRSRNGKPLLRVGIDIAANEVIWTEVAALAVTNASTDACECCLLKEDIHGMPKGTLPAPCCDNALNKIWSPCFIRAKSFYHVCGDYDEDKENHLHNALRGYQVPEFGHAVLLIRRVLQMCRHAANMPEGTPIHPLQVDIIPFLPSDCERLIPWSYRHGIIQALDMLMGEGIDVFLDDDWDIRTILTLWRKLGPIDWNTVAMDPLKVFIGEVEIETESFSCVYPMYPFLSHSCRPNAKVHLDILKPCTFKLEALRPIRAGEYITVSRIGVAASSATSLNERREAFVGMGMKRCPCDACVRDAKVAYKAQHPAGMPIKTGDADAAQWASKLAARRAAIERSKAEMEERLPQQKELNEEQKEKLLALVKTEEEIKWKEYQTALKGKGKAKG